MSFVENYGPTAVVTGGSKGIGKEFARQLAQRGLDVLIVARGERDLSDTSREIYESTGRTITPICGDLTDLRTVESVIERCRDLEIGLLVNNASGGTPGAFLRHSEPDWRSIDLNIKVPLALTQHFGLSMIQRGRGGIVFVSGLSAYAVTPYLASTGAANAFRLSLGESLHYEFKDHGVDVLVLAPGAVRTPGFSGHDIDFSKVVKNPMEPDLVVAAALASLGRQAVVTPGRYNRFARFMMQHVMPRSMLAKEMGTMLRQAIHKDLL